MAETLEQAVKRIVDETFDKYNAMKFRTQADAMEAAIRQGIAWAYLDAIGATELERVDAESTGEESDFAYNQALVDVAVALGRKAEEAGRG